MQIPEVLLPSEVAHELQITPQQLGSYRKRGLIKGAVLPNNEVRYIRREVNKLKKVDTIL